MISQEILFHVPHMPDRGKTYVLEALAADEHVDGSFTRRCAHHLEQTYGPNRVLLTHSATAGLELAAMLLAAATGTTRVFMPSYTFSSTANAFLRAGYDLTFVDIDPGRMDAGVSQFEAADPPEGSVIVPVHYAGDPGEIDLLETWAAERGIHVIEDAAQALGSRIGGAHAGTFGTAGVISFHHTKNVHASMGGALFINDPSLVEMATHIWERGTNRQAFLRGTVDKYSWVEVGSSFQGTEMQAALLLAGLEELETITDSRRALWNVYEETLGGSDRAGLFTPSPSRGETNCHAYFVRLESPKAAEALRIHMRERGIHLYSHYVPLHNSPLGIRLGLDRPLPQTERWAECLLRLPLHTTMSPADAQKVCDGIVNWLEART